MDGLLSRLIYLGGNPTQEVCTGRQLATVSYLYSYDTSLSLYVQIIICIL